METFSLLKHWKGGGASGITFRSAKPSAITTISTILQSTDDDHEEPFFDYEFSLSHGDGRKGKEHRDSDYSIEEEREFNASLSPSRTSIGQDDTDQLLEEGGLVQLNPTENPSKLQIPLTLYKTAKGFRVLMHRFRKVKAEDVGEDHNLEHNKHWKTLNTDFKEQEVPISSFTRDYNSKSRIRKLLHVNDDDKHLKKERDPKDPELINSPHVKSSKVWEEEEVGFSGPLGLGTGKGNKKPRMQSKNSANTSQKQVSFSSGFRVIHWRKSRSSSVSVPSTMQIHRRDDSLVHDSIQSAIAHCKKSFNASNGHQDWIKES